MKKLIGLALALVLIFTLGACSSATSASSGAPATSTASTASTASAGGTKANKDIYIAMFPKGYVGDVWKAVERGANDAAAKYGVKLTVEAPQSETDVDGQNNLIENAINKGADVIAIAPLDDKGSVPVIERAAQAGIKVIAYNSTLDSDIPLTQILTDNKKIGDMAGEALAKAMGGKGKYAIVGSNEAVAIARERCDYTKDYIDAHYPDMKCITIQYTLGDLNRALGVTSDIITANPDITGIYSNNETTSIAVATVLQEKHLGGKIKHVGFDATKQTAVFLKDGTTQALVGQRTYDMGYITVEKAIAAYKGEKLDPTYDVPIALVTSENIETDDIKMIIDPITTLDAKSK